MLGKAYYLLDSKGKRLLSYEKDGIEYLGNAGEGYLRVEYENGETALIDQKRKGAIQNCGIFDLSGFGGTCQGIESG